MEEGGAESAEVYVGTAGPQCDVTPGGQKESET